MEDLRKVNSLQFYSFWKNLSIGLLVWIATLAFCRMLPFYAAPVVSVLAALFLYGVTYNSRMSEDGSCTLVLYSLLYSTINFTVVTVALNVLALTNVITLPKELTFLEDPFVPSLLMNPVAFVTFTVLYLRRNHLSCCRECKLKAGDFYERGRTGQIFRYESYYQLRNLATMFGVLSLLVWGYYYFVFMDLNVNARDWYVFTWLTVIAIVIDEVYFIFRYYNLYLDLKDSDEIISQEELQDMTAKTYLRFYLICDNKIFFDPHSIDSQTQYREVINTPLITKRAVNGIPLPEVRNIIRKMTGDLDGELKFFYGRKSTDLKNHSVLRYFYFLPGKPEDYPEMPVPGEWMDFEDVKRIYTRTPGRFNSMTVMDLSRLATIILTEKIFNEDGKRKNKIKSYNPSFNLHDVKNSQLDFQDDKWVRISMFNSDTPFYSIKKFFKGKPKTR
ncbi:MAG: hypothetical protein K2H35_01555 [Muribaculaceae bacterium]|nr:hypothetical protein [Muribaculaceae bacterium]MDE6559467.1 hypothetical protein [Muribaculaceae bacterium]